MKTFSIVIAIALLAALLWWLAPFAFVVFVYFWAALGGWIIALAGIGFVAWRVYRYFKKGIAQ